MKYSLSNIIQHPIKSIKDLFAVNKGDSISYLIVALGIVSISDFVGYHLGRMIGLVVAFFAWFYILKALRGVKFSRPQLNGLVGLLTVFILIWSLFIVVHGFIAETPAKYGLQTIIRRFFVDDTLLLPMLFPLVLFMRIDIYKFNFLFKWMLVFCALYIILSPFALWSMLHWDWAMHVADSTFGEEGTYGDFITNSTLHISAFLPIAFMYYCKRYLNNRVWFCFLLTAIINLLMIVYMARRGGTVTQLGYFFAALWVYFHRSKGIGGKMAQVLILTVIVILVFSLFNNYSDSLFSNILERGTIDSRSEVWSSFFSDMNKTPIDWWIGRGLFGVYYEPTLWDVYGIPYRDSIETGYLRLILKGGYIYAWLYILILLISGLKGILFGKNVLVNTLGCLIIISLLELYPFGWPTFNFKYFVIWIGVYICNNRTLRNMNDKEIGDKLIS